MRFITELQEGDRVSGIYLCNQKQSAMTKNGKPYDNVILQDKTGVLDGKIWDPNSLGIDDFDTLDYIDVVGDVTTFAGAMQLNIKRVRKASEGEYNPANYLPVSENSTDDMYGQILNMIKTVKNEYLSALSYPGRWGCPILPAVPEPPARLGGGAILPGHRAAHPPRVAAVQNRGVRAVGACRRGRRVRLSAAGRNTPPPFQCADGRLGRRHPAGTSRRAAPPIQRPAPDFQPAAARLGAVGLYRLVQRLHRVQP